ncbi:MAG: thiosulfate oxidation carrier protein SoxY [Pseudomonadota bacterium]|jgi:sulfur-oxidizing protein SoxY|uniref:thiosulfate oxidation carrier protein SoxY n=1 Tax=Polaromonas sp. YR568 TaxID=1855301 RepID=UPI0027173B12|nr:thiosulfate oxidation carrier protein SoxY [Polaromonas sp.]MDO9259102.1 thiosulfate oxidation carrier protein SoxY [Polaromonas sp.]
MERRHFLATSSGATALALAASAGLVPAHAQTAPAWNKAAFESKTLAEVVKAIGASGAPVESKDLVLQAPEIAENGSVVRVGAQSNIAGTTQLALVVEKNPSVLAALFDIPAGTDANVSTNLKMGQSSNVYALAKVGDKLFYAVKEVKVTLGGCGG